MTNDRTITVTGSGRASAAADRAEVRLGVQLSRPSAAEARRDGAALMDAVVAAVAAAGAGSDDVRTAQVALYPMYEHDPGGRQRLAGYQLTNQVAITVRRLEDVGRILDEAIEAGASTVESLTFALADDRPLAREALAAAVADARARAEVLATAGSVRLGEVASISEKVGRSGPPGPMFARMEAAAADTPVVPGDVEVAASVVVVFRIEDAPGA